ncbi:MAG: transglycosylase domain-containing protein [Hyphomicrobiaceae bacterium]
MLELVRLLTRAVELLVWLPVRLARLAVTGVAFNPRLGPLRHIFTLALAYVAFALLLVYIVAPIRGIVGAAFEGAKLNYDAERWLATSIHDTSDRFLGTFHGSLDSAGDVNTTGQPIEFGDYTANPDHKSIPVREVPPWYWACLAYHEDRYIGTALNPFGIDLVGVLKIPYSTIRRSITLRRPSLGVGGSTLPMQLARVIYKTPPRRSEGPLTKLGRKLSEWWIAPVIYAELTRGGDPTRLKQWAANHLWLAQRAGGTSLHGVELAAQIVFGREAKELSIAQQFVLASAVNKPIILLEGSERLNAVRLDRWRYIAEVRARTCAEKLIRNPVEQKQALFDLVQMAGGPPDPKAPAPLVAALESTQSQGGAQRAMANPELRANLLLPAGRFGLIEELKQAFGRDWRNHVRSVTTTLDAGDNLAFGRAIRDTLTRLDGEWAGRLAPGYTLDPAKADPDRRLPHIAVVAADENGRIVRYFDSSEQALYFGSPWARTKAKGTYERDREPRAIASTGKMLAAIAIANAGRDTTRSLYVDADAPARGLEGCRHGGGLRRGRSAEVAFACSLNRPIEWRLARLGQSPVQHLIERFGFNMPPPAADGSPTPATTAAVRGLIAGSPQRVHYMAAVTLAALSGQGTRPVRPPTLIADVNFRSPDAAELFNARRNEALRPSSVIAPSARPLVRRLLEAPLCYEAKGIRHGTLKSLAEWCAARRKTVALHIAKTGTHVTADPDATVDVWVTGGIRFHSGQRYSYVVVIGTGHESYARKLHAAQVGAPLAAVLLADLERLAKRSPSPRASSAGPTATRQDRARHQRSAQSLSIRALIDRQLTFSR